MEIIIVKNVNANLFYEAINNAMKSNARAKFVDIYDKREYNNMKLLTLIDNGTAGFAITKDNNITSLFKDAEKGNFITAIDLLIPIAVINGGIRMDCYGEYLARRYMKHGFVSVARCKFNDDYAPRDWNYELNGRPDLYFLVRFTNNIDALVRESAIFNDSYFDYIKDSLPYMNYEDAINYAIEKTRTISKSDNLSYKHVIESIVNENNLNRKRGVRI